MIRVNVRNEKNRKKLAAKYKFVRAYVERILQEEGSLGDAGAIVFKYMYHILIENIETAERVEVKCGRFAAQDLMEKLGYDMSAIFNPYILKNSKVPGTGREMPSDVIKHNPVAIQLKYATAWLLIILPQYPGGPLERINMRVTAHEDVEPPIRDVLKVNDILRKYRIADLEEYIIKWQGGSLNLKRKVLDFEKLDKIVRSFNEKSFFCGEKTEA